MKSSIDIPLKDNSILTPITYSEKIININHEQDFDRIRRKNLTWRRLFLSVFLIATTSKCGGHQVGFVAYEESKTDVQIALIKYEKNVYLNHK